MCSGAKAPPVSSEVETTPEVDTPASRCPDTPAEGCVRLPTLTTVDTMNRGVAVSGTSSPSRNPFAWILLILALGFGIGITFPYWSLDTTESRLTVGSELQYSVLIVHICTAAVALVLGPLQFMPRLRAHRRIHRAIGRGYLLAGVLPAAVSAVPVALWSGRIITQIGLTTAAVLWLIMGVLAYRAAVRRDFAAHRAWMIRNYALALLAVTARILTPVLLLAQILLSGADPEVIREQVDSMIPVGQTVGWIVNLVVAEVIVIRRPLKRNFGDG